MTKDVFAFIGLWVVVAGAQNLFRKCREFAAQQA